MEYILLGGLGLAIALLLTLLIRIPKVADQSNEHFVALAGRLEGLGSDMSRIEGSLQMMSGAQEGRIQSLAQTTAASLEAQRAAVDQKLSQALAESREGRAELGSSFAAFEAKLTLRTTALETTLSTRSVNLERQLTTSLETIGMANRQALESLKTDVTTQLGSMVTALREQLDGNGTQMRTQLSLIQESIAQQLANMVQSSQQNAEQLRTALNERLTAIQTDNATKLEEMRKTVDEKLHATLEQRLGQSFQLVSDRLEQVHRGLGEMQNLAVGVGDLKRVLTNVKARGTWGEVQLEAMIEQILTPEQYQKNAAIRPGRNERVEIAIRLPGRDANEPVWLPIDAKFPVEDYQRLIDAHDRADVEQVEVAAKALEMRIRNEARTICEKYLEPPHTTDFAIMYLPTEGLYAEVLRRPGLAEAMQREHRVMISGPTNLAALLNSLQMGFRTLAIEKRSSEVWSLLGAVKNEFGKFGTVIAATQKKLEAATNQFGEVGKRTRAIERKLRDVEVLPLPEGEIPPAIALADEDEESGNII
ncbi:MAG: DNA recombination protein RmuC [Rhodocyclaceae bacterium]|nr:DNA recombination protein RmuC [Rhodocyclaceae bacterium]